MYGRELLNRLDFQNDLVSDDEIQFLLRQQLTAISDLVSLLALEGDPRGRQFEANCTRIDSLVQTWPKRTVYRYAATDRVADQLLDIVSEWTLNAQHWILLSCFLSLSRALVFVSLVRSYFVSFVVVFSSPHLGFAVASKVFAFRAFRFVSFVRSYFVSFVVVSFVVVSFVIGS